jgi:hypothetical protein
MCHGTHERRNKGCHQQATACCCGASHGWRRFQTKEEKVAKLEKYVQSLETEAKAVQEHIAALKGE